MKNLILISKLFPNSTILLSISFGLAISMMILLNIFLYQMGTMQFSLPSIRINRKCPLWIPMLRLTEKTDRILQSKIAYRLHLNSVNYVIILCNKRRIKLFILWISKIYFKLIHSYILNMLRFLLLCWFTVGFLMVSLEYL